MFGGEIMQESLKRLLKHFASLNYSENEALSSHTSIRVGGRCKLFIEVESTDVLAELLQRCRAEGIPYIVLGNGSNMLFSDDGFDGVVLHIGKGMADMHVHDGIIEAQAGVSLAALANFAQKNSLSGLEFASGIPGSLGGAVLMNAGAYGGEMCQVILDVSLMDASGRVFTLSNEEMAFGYRKSKAMQERLIVLSARMQLRLGDKDAILALQQELNQRRREKQPLNFPSAGSFFKRPTGYFAGALIEGAGLKGKSIGGAQVSLLHAGFLINTGNASAADFVALMRLIQETIKEKYDVVLEPEVRLIGV